MSIVKGFNGIRGLAVIAVILTHLHIYNKLESHHLITPAIKSLINGSAGVQAFFVLSGFLITMLLIKEFERNGFISIKNFFIRRTLRIFPLYILFLIVTTVLFLIDHKVSNSKSLTFLYLYIYNFIPKESYTGFLGHTWSLAVEEHFYLLWPFVFICLIKWTFKTRLCLLVAAIFGAQILFFLLLKLNLDAKYFIERWSFITGYNILLGCLISIIIHSSQCRDKLSSLLNKKALLIGFLIYVSSAFLFTEELTNYQIAAAFARSIGICIFVLYVYINQTGRLVNFLENKILSYIGLISYGIYMYQGLFLATGPERISGVLWPPNQITGIVLLIIVAPISYHFFEKPFISLKAKFQNKKTLAP